MTVPTQTVIQDLRDLVAALDRRVPRLERAAEPVIARDAQGLRRAALNRIAELERSVTPLERDDSAHEAHSAE